MDKVFGLSMLNHVIKTDVERSRISKAPSKVMVLINGNDVSKGVVRVERLELRQYYERFDKTKGFYSLITVYMKSDRGMIELRFDEGFKGDDPLQEIFSNLTKYMGLESIINRILIEFEET